MGPEEAPSLRGGIPFKKARTLLQVGGSRAVPLSDGHPGKLVRGWVVVASFAQKAWFLRQGSGREVGLGLGVSCLSPPPAPW